MEERTDFRELDVAIVIEAILARDDRHHTVARLQALPGAHDTCQGTTTMMADPTTDVLRTCRAT